MDAKQVICMIVAVLGLSWDAWAQRSIPMSRPPDRVYTNKVQMHEVNIGVSVPSAASEEIKNAPSPKSMDFDTKLEPSQPLANIQNLYRPTPPVSDKSDKKQRNWLTISPEGEIDTKAVEEKKETGWGWLADEVMARQTAAEPAKTEDSETSSFDQEDTDTAAKEESKETVDGKKESGDTRGLIKDNVFKPVEARDVVEESEEDKASRESADEDKKEYQKDVQDEKRESIRNGGAEEAGARATEDSKYGADKMWGSDKVLLSSRDEQRPSMPQTAAILSEIIAPKQSEVKSPSSLEMKHADESQMKMNDAVMNPTKMFESHESRAVDSAGSYGTLPGFGSGNSYGGLPNITASKGIMSTMLPTFNAGGNSAGSLSPMMPSASSLPSLSGAPISGSLQPSGAYGSEKPMNDPWD